MSQTELAVVGAGRLGTALALAVRARGGRISGFTCRTQQGCERAGHLLDLPACSTLLELMSTEPNLILLTVADAALPQTARDLAAASRAAGGSRETPALVLHTSGATSVDVLAPLAELGHPTLALHPLQTFADPLSGASKFAGASFAVTPGPLADYSQGARLAEELGGRPFPLAEEDRPLYHAAAVFASNYLVTIAWLAEELVRASGLRSSEALSSLLPLMQGALDNLEQRGAVQALTGPLSRGDESTITRHQEALACRHPDILPVYNSLGLATMDLVTRRGELPADALARLRAALTERPSSGLASSPTGGAEPVNP